MHGGGPYVVKGVARRQNGGGPYVVKAVARRLNGGGACMVVVHAWWWSICGEGGS
jgi:hypothetical protein